MSRLYTEVRGSGPALVLLHGWGLNLRVWDGLTAALCDRFRIIAVDLPGHGRSVWVPERSSLAEQAAQIAATVGAITAEYSLLGWSLGGQMALQLAATADQAPDRLVLIAATPRLTAGPDWPHGPPPERLAAQAQGLETDYRRTVSDFLELQVRGSAGSACARLRFGTRCRGGMLCRERRPHKPHFPAIRNEHVPVQAVWRIRFEDYSDATDVSGCGWIGERGSRCTSTYKCGRLGQSNCSGHRDELYRGRWNHE